MNHGPTVEFSTTQVQDKPWGHEAIFAAGEHGYVGKLIAVSAGHALSLQYHDEKDETLSIVSGEATFEHGRSADRLASRVMRPGDTAHVPALLLHRITALSDLVFAEASTAAPGWRDDVTRLADRYGRDGTRAP
ncbi:cupin domain-containing protein [Cellulomonas rhizosphaerae]|uniref:Cupin n=1 Tax=Cellulomonas rhizosphaerae TaxID=2293719 RepID=A0A413RN06_9CELL|nr:cupin [Cellulomonas rhizosphaerae]RHA42675.1 cupin [Cellulomonas rhizosphaerae]